MRMSHKSIPKLIQQISFHRKYVTITINKYSDLKFTSVLEQKYAADCVWEQCVRTRTTGIFNNLFTYQMCDKKSTHIKISINGQLLLL